MTTSYLMMNAANPALLLLHWAAAARGVRVRVLVDDLYTTGEDELLLVVAM